MMSKHRSLTKDTLSARSIMDMVFAFQRSRVLLTAYELGLFTVLGDESKSSIEVAKALGTGDRATDRLMNALCAIGLLEKKRGRFSSSPLASRFLVKDSPDFMAGLMHSVHLWDTWSTLTQAVRHGKSVVARHANERGEEWLTEFITAMHQRACQQAPGVVALLDLSGTSRVLDIGGGSGAYSMAFAQAKEEIRAMVFDLPNVIALTRDYIEKEGLSNKVETVVGDYNIDELGSGFDLVFLSAIIHSNSSEGNRELIRKGSEALNPQGQMVIQDFVMDEGRTTPALGALFALNMLVATESGDTYTESEIRMWMEEAGLPDIVRKDTSFGTSLIIGRRTQN